MNALPATRTDRPTFGEVLKALSPDERARVEAAARPAAAAAGAASAHWDFAAPASAADAVLEEGGGRHGDRVRRGLVARWALDLPGRLGPLGLPTAVHDLVPDALDRLAGHLAELGTYDPDHWAKDVRFALGLTVPCGAQVVDLRARIGPGEVARHVLAGRGIGTGIGYVAAGGWGNWLQIHTESRWLADFDEAGWDRCWRRVAALLRTRPEARGVMGASWFYDPPLTEISPRLAYLQRRPLENGAFLIHQGPDSLSIERCTAASPTRRALVEAGLYTPRAWILAWPRAGLLRWAEASA